MRTASRRLLVMILLGVGLVAGILLFRKPPPVAIEQTIARGSYTPGAPSATTTPATLSAVSRAAPSVEIEPDEMAAPEFACRVRIQEYRKSYPAAPSDVLQMLACGDTGSAVDALSALAQTGDHQAYAALMTIAASGCTPASPEKLERFFASTIQRARQRGASASTLERIAQIAVIEQRKAAPEHTVHCRRAEREVWSLVPSLMQEVSDLMGRSWAKLMLEDEEAVELEVARKDAAAGNELALASLLLGRKTKAATEEAVSILERLSDTQPHTKAELAVCKLSNCDGRGDRAVAMRLLTEAALEGSIGALYSLSIEPRMSQIAETSPGPSERYAWRQLRYRLAELGCLGAQEYLNWATRSADEDTLLQMSPSEDAAARARAQELLTELPRVRPAFGC